MDKYYCPITKQIFSDPVVAEDGQIYEKRAIKTWLESNNTSPLTRLTIKKDLFPIFQFRDEVNEFLKKNPKYREYQYDNLKDYNKIEIIKIMEHNHYHKLLKYADFKLNETLVFTDFKKYNFTKLVLQKCNDNIIYHVIDRSIDLTTDIFNFVDITDCKKLPIHYICKYGDPEFIKYIIENKDINLECQDINNNTPINYLIKYYREEDDLINLLVNKDASLQINKENSPMHDIFKYCNWNVIKNIINKKLNYKVYDKYGMMPIHYLCKRDILTKNILKYLLKNNVNIYLKTKSGYDGASLIVMHQKNKIIKYLFENMNRDIDTHNINIKIITFDKDNSDSADNIHETDVSFRTLLYMNNNLTNAEIKRLFKILSNNKKTYLSYFRKD